MTNKTKVAIGVVVAVGLAVVIYFETAAESPIEIADGGSVRLEFKHDFDVDSKKAIRASKVPRRPRLVEWVDKQGIMESISVKGRDWTLTLASGRLELRTEAYGAVTDVPIESKDGTELTPEDAKSKKVFHFGPLGDKLRFPAKLKFTDAKEDEPGGNPPCKVWSKPDRTCTLCPGADCTEKILIQYKSPWNGDH